MSPHRWNVIAHDRPTRDDVWDVEIDVQDPEFADTVERLAVRRIGDDVFQVCCIPFLLHGVGLDDVVRVRGLDPGSPGSIAGLVEDAGRTVVRVSPTPASAAVVDSLASVAASSGLRWEILSDRLIAIDIGPDQEPHPVHEVLLRGQDDGAWECELGRAGT